MKQKPARRKRPAKPRNPATVDVNVAAKAAIDSIAARTERKSLGRKKA
ncbi:MAG: hypothetical protein WD749_05080 [Phycisphaerales bacterium]